MTQTRISITEPNGVKRMMPLSARGLTIGRGTDNDLVINYPTTSRYHAQITFDGSYYYVTDLNSGNGTYLGNERIAPNEPVVWTPGVPLYIGEVTLQMEESQHQPQLQPQQTQRPGRHDRQNTETIAGWASPFQEQKKRGNRLWMILVFILGLLCVCAALGAGGYFWFGSG